MDENQSRRKQKDKRTERRESDSGTLVNQNASGRLSDQKSDSVIITSHQVDPGVLATPVNREFDRSTESSNHNEPDNSELSHVSEKNRMLESSGGPGDWSDVIAITELSASEGRKADTATGLSAGEGRKADMVTELPAGRGKKADTVTELPAGGGRKDGPRSAITDLYLLEYGVYDGQPASKVLLVPHTGRSHQLRVHCKYLGELSIPCLCSLKCVGIISLPELSRLKFIATHITTREATLHPLQR